MNIIKPLKLNSGDKVGIISPSEPVIFRKKFERGVEVLRELGLCVILGRNVFKKYGAYMAGNDSQRASDLNAMFKNPEIKGIFCSRGGLSCNRLLNLMDYGAIKKNPKVFMGFSDITVLLNAIYKKTGLITFHGPNIEHIFSKGFSGKNRYTWEYFFKAVMRNQPVGRIKPWRSLEVLKEGRASGGLVGGNLITLMTLMGTEYEPDWRNKILFWEETYETIQEIDFHLTHLRSAGVFGKISGMIIGKLMRCNILRGDDDWKKAEVFSINKIILEICHDYKFPIMKGVAFGHYSPQIVVPIGVKATIDTSRKLFSIDEAGVK